MIQKFTEYVATALSLTLGQTIYSRRFKTFTGTACCLYDGRYSSTSKDPASLQKREIIAEARSLNPVDAENMATSIYELFVNKSNINISGFSKYVTVTASPPRQLAELDDRGYTRYVSELVVTSK